MGLEIKQTQDICVEKLTSVTGQDLEIMANLTHPAQIDAVMEGYVDAVLGSAFGVRMSELLLRLSCSYKGRARDDLTAIGGKTAQVPGWTPVQTGVINDH